MRCFEACALAVLVAPSTGCYTFTVLGRARTVPRRNVEVLVASGVTGTAAFDGDANVRPSFEVGVRYGVTGALDVGARVGDYGGSVTARVQLTRSSRESSGVDVLLAPGVAYTLTDKMALELPCLVGFNIHGGHQIVLAPRVAYQLRFGVGDLDHPAQFFFVGGSAGFVWKLGRHVALMPEVGVLATLYAEPGFTSFTRAGPGVDAALGVIWDP